MSDLPVINFGNLLVEPPSYGANVPAAPILNGWPRYIRITDISETGDLILNDIKGIEPKIAQPYLLKVGDILIARSGNTVGKAYIHRDAELRAAHAGYLIRFRVDKDKADPLFLFHYLHSGEYWAWIQSSSKVAAQPNINAKQYSCLPIPDINLSEQLTISTILDTVDTTIQQTEAVIAKLKKVKAGMLHDLLTRGLDENGQLRDPIHNPELFKDSPLGKIPVEWGFNKLGSLISTLETGVSVNAWDKPVGGGDIGILKTSCVHSGSFFPGKNKTVFPRDKRRVSCPVRCNSIIISRMNTPLLVGESGYIDQNFSNLYLPDRLWQLLVIEEKIGSVKWLSYVLNWKPVRKSIRDIATGTSGSMKNISKGALLSIYITIPQPEEQCIIASRLNAFDELLRKETNELIKLQQCKQALMQDLLTGKVRVPEKLMEALP